MVFAVICASHQPARVQEGISPLIAAAAQDRPNFVTLYLSLEGVQVNASDRVRAWMPALSSYHVCAQYGWTALMYAVAARSEACVASLLEAGASLECAASSGRKLQDVSFPRGSTAASIARRLGTNVLADAQAMRVS